MKTRIFHTKFWSDPYIIDLTPKARLLYNYYLTNDRIGLTGIYEVPKMFIQVSTGLSVDEIHEYNKKFSDDRKIMFIDEWVCIVNAAKYQSYTGEKNDKARENEEKTIPLAVRAHFSRYTIDTLSAVSDSPINQIRNKKSEYEVDPDEAEKAIEELGRN